MGRVAIVTSRSNPLNGDAAEAKLMSPQKPQSTSGTDARRCSIRVLSQGSNLVIAQGSGLGTPPLKAKKAAAEAPQAAAVPRLRKTQFLRALPLTEE